MRVVKLHTDETPNGTEETPHRGNQPATDPARPTPSEEALNPALDPLLVGAVEAARVCGVSPASWYRAVAAGRIGPAPVKLGGRVLYRVEDLREWVRLGLPDRRTWQAMQAQRNGHD